MIIQCPYKTTVTEGYRVADTERQLRDYAVWAGGWNREASDIQIRNILEVTTRDEQQSTMVNAFNHPLFTDEKWFVDQRPHTRFSMRDHTTTIVNHAEFNFNRMRVQVCYAYAQPNGIPFIRDFSNLPMVVYASWISEQVARRFSLDHASQYRLYIFAAIYYQSLFLDEKEWGGDYALRIAKRVSTDLRVQSSDVLDILDSLDTPLRDIADFCSRVASVVGNVRLNDFNHALLFTLIGGTWQGYNSREIACMALEHVPTFVCMINAAINDRGFGQSPFSKLVQRKGKREQTDFTIRLNNVVQSYYDVR